MGNSTKLNCRAIFGASTACNIPKVCFLVPIEKIFQTKPRLNFSPGHNLNFYKVSVKLEVDDVSLSLKYVGKI